ncbi:MAG: DNA polymerase III subunit delta [Clostridia bacterium]|nr:DNA polymerase III subunit delta [Clostridia bacterium]
MPINEKALRNGLKAGALTPVYLIYGNDNFLKKQAADLIIKAAVPEDDGFNLLRYEYGCELQEVYDELCAFPIMSDKKCVIFYDFDIDNASSADFEKLLELSSQRYETAVLVLQFIALAPDFKKSERGKKLLAAVEKAGGIVAEINHRTREELIGQLVSSAKKHGVTLSPSVSAYLIDSCSTDVNILSNEISKLSAYVKSGNEITKETIDAVAVKTVEASVYGISEKILSGDAQGSLKLLDELYFTRLDTRIIFFQIASGFVDMYRTLAFKSKGVSLEQAGLDFKMGNRAFLLKKADIALRKIDEKALGLCFDILIDADRQLKGYSQDDKIILEKLILRLIYAIKTGEALD